MTIPTAVPLAIYHTTDPHSNLPLLKDFVESAEPNSLLAISGDIKDWNGKATAEELKEWTLHIQSLADAAATKGCHLAVCSGNHDRWSTDSSLPSWLELVGENLHGDFSNKRLFIQGQETILTCIPWRDYEPDSPVVPERLGKADRKVWAADVHAHERIVQMLEEAKAWRDERRLPWVILHHSPPSRTIASGGYEASDILRRWIFQYEPTVVLCGHMHTAPFLSGGDVSCRMGRTLISNPGRSAFQLRINQLTLRVHGPAWSAECRTIKKEIPFDVLQASTMHSPTVGGIELLPVEQAALPAQKRWPRVRDLPEAERGPFLEWLWGSTIPVDESLPDDEQDCYYPWDYKNWKTGAPWWI